MFTQVNVNLAQVDSKYSTVPKMHKWAMAAHNQGAKQSLGGA